MKFTGHLIPADLCEIKTPHFPHIIGQYDTVRYGKLDKFCEGIPGDPPLFRAKFIKGDAWVPDTLIWEEV